MAAYRPGTNSSRNLAIVLFDRTHSASGLRAGPAPADWGKIRLRYGRVLALNAARSPGRESLTRSPDKQVVPADAAAKEAHCPKSKTIPPRVTCVNAVRESITAALRIE
jgi:hypothetical protein